MPLTVEKIMNQGRASWGLAALTAFCASTGLDMESGGAETVVCDLLADLRHWCRTNGVRFEDVARKATVRFAQEVADELVEDKDANTRLRVLAVMFADPLKHWTAVEVSEKLGHRGPGGIVRLFANLVAFRMVDELNHNKPSVYRITDRGVHALATGEVR